MTWVVKIDGKRKLTTKDPAEASRKALLWWGRSGRTALVQIYTLGTIYSESLVEEWLPDEKRCTCWQEPGDINCPIHNGEEDE